MPARRRLPSRRENETMAEHSPAAATLRMRRLRQRRDRGVALVARVEVSEAAVAALLAAGRLVATPGPDGKTRINRADVESALAELIEDFANDT